MRPILLATLLLLAACGGTPPAPGTRQADADTCATQATDAVDKQTSKRFLTWLAAPVTRWSRIGRDEGSCMSAKGWAVTRTCTAEELRQGDANPNVVVTASGIRCRDPGRG